MRIVLVTAYGERPMRPDFGCGIHDYVFAPADATTAGIVAYEVRNSLVRWEPRVEIVERPRAPSSRRARHADDRHPLHDQALERPAQPRFPVLHHPGGRGLAPARRSIIDRVPGGIAMALPAPNLDDRRFQELVDDAKRLVQQRCPEWSDHNVSDPGVTLIELFAWMTDQVVYRLNRVPGPQLRQVPRADRRAPVPAERRQGRRHVLALRAAGRHDEDHTRDAGLHGAHRDAGGDQLRDRSRSSRSRPCSVHRVFSQIEEEKTREPHVCGRARPELLLLRQGPQGRRRADGRPLRGGAVVRGQHPPRVQHRGPRRRSAQPAARLGGLGRRGLERVRARRRRDRRPEPGRQRRSCTSRAPTSRR